MHAISWRLYVCLLIGTARSCSTIYADEVIQADAILNYFGSTCPSQGEWTRSALGQTHALIDTLKSAEKDSDCQTLAGAVGQIELLSRQLESVGSWTQDTAIQGYKKQQENLAIQLASTTDPIMKQAILFDLREVQSNLAYEEGVREARLKDYEIRRRGDALQNLVLSTNILLNQAIANQTCLLKRPNILSGLTAMAGSVWAGLATSGTSLAVAAGTQLFGNILDAIRRYSIAKKIAAMSDIVVQPALSCALESMQQQWCSANDAFHMIQYKTAPYSDSDPFIWTVHLLTKDLPTFLQWLDSVQAGSEKATLAEAGRATDVIFREATVKSARVNGPAALIQNRRNYFLATNNELKWSVIKSTVISLLASLGIQTMSSVSSGPLTEIYDSIYSPFYLLGFSSDEVPRVNGGRILFSDLDPKVNWPQGKPFPPDYDAIGPRLIAWISLAEEKVSDERSIVTLPDPLVIFRDAISPANQGPFKSLIPKESIQRLHDFLQRYQPTAHYNEIQKRLHAETAERLEFVLGQIQLAETESKEIQDSELLKKNLLKALNDIYAKAQLGDGGIFRERLSRALRTALTEALLTNSSQVDPSSAAHLLAANDIVQDLLSLSPTPNLSEIQRDLGKSQEVTRKTIQVFAETFKSNFRSILLRLKNDADVERQTHSKTRFAQDDLAEICLELLSVPNLPRSKDFGIPVEVCYGEQLLPLWRNAPASRALSANTFSLDLSDRICALRDYHRTQKIFQDRSDQTLR